MNIVLYQYRNKRIDEIKMSKKQNNDDVSNAIGIPGSTETDLQKDKKNQPQSQRNNMPSVSQQQNVSSVRASKKQSQMSSTKHVAKQSQILIAGSQLNPSPSIMLPITIHELEQKKINLYLKQFMQITTFQTIQKGKQLIDLLKQSPGNKHTFSIVNKCLKLFKSNIPDAVLCSFQFFRELIEVGYWKVTDAVQEALLIPIVEIIQYRSYVPHIERGNTYFLNQVNRYGTDDKTNHLVKIGSTFFRMVHQVLYVWGTFYFPASNFSKMLDKLITSKNIKFPQFPHEFRFYSQARVEMYKNLIEKNKQTQLQEELEFKNKKPLEIPKDLSNQKRDEKIIVQKQSKRPSTPNLKENKLQASNVKDANQQKSPSSKKDQKQAINNVSQQKPQEEKKENLSNKAEQQDEDLESITLKKQIVQKVEIVEQKKIHSPSKSVDEFKRIKPSKIKAKKSTLSINPSQKSNDIQKSRAQSFLDVDNALKMIEQVAKIQIAKPKLQKHETEQFKQAEVKNNLAKLAISNKSGKHNQEGSQIETSENGQVVNSIVAQQTFRAAQNKKFVQKIKEYEVKKSEKESQMGTVRVLSSERERYIESVSDESQVRENFSSQTRKQVDKKNTQPNYNDYNEGAFKEFFKKELQSMKNSIIQGVKQDINRIIDRKISISQRPQQNDTCNGQTISGKNILPESNKKNQNNQGNKSDQQTVSARFGTNTVSIDTDPSVEAFQFIKKKFKSGKKIRTSSKLKRPSILSDEELRLHQKQQNFIEAKQNQNQRPIILQHKIAIDHGVNTQQIRHEQIYQEINSLKQKLNLMTANISKPNQLTANRNNHFFASPKDSNSFLITPNAINKNQLQNFDHSNFQTASLRSTVNTSKKKSKSKLSERRSSLEATLLQKAVLGAESCGNLFEQVYGGKNSLLFNAALSSVQKKRKSVMFC